MSGEPKRGPKHSWRLVAFCGGWESYDCLRCGRTEIPNLFGRMSSDWLRWIIPSRRCHPLDDRHPA